MAKLLYEFLHFWQIVVFLQSAIMRKQTVTAQMLADALGGEVVGNPSREVSGPARIEYARSGNICFYANPKYEKYVYGTEASVLLVCRDFVPKQKLPDTLTLIKVDDAYASVPVLLGYFSSVRRGRLRGNRFLARLRMGIAPSARIGRGTHIFPGVYIGPGCRIGRDCILYPGVRIYSGCIVGDGCIIHANAVIGADGFGFAPLDSGAYRKIPQTGNVVLEDNVEIGASTCIDRATMDSTLIHRGVKIDDLCMIAHNVEIGADTVMAAQSGIAGSTHVGARCVIAGKVGIAGHLSIADGTTICAGSGVQGSVRESGKVLMGYPAIDYHKYMRAYAIFKNSPSER